MVSIEFNNTDLFRRLMKATGNKYTFKGELSTNGTSKRTYLAVDKSGTEFIVKTIWVSKNQYDKPPERIMAEIKVFDKARSGATYIEHIETSGVIANFNKQDIYYLISRRVTSYDSTLNGYNKTMTEKDVLEFGCHVCKGLIELNDLVKDDYKVVTLVHRDVKPDNVLYDDGKYVLTDFGSLKLARVTIAGTITDEPVTPEYAAPERCGFLVERNHEYVNQLPKKYDSYVDALNVIIEAQEQRNYYINSDVFSLGVSMLYLLTGKYPRDFENNNPESSNSISPALAKILKKALEDEPKNRYRSAERFLLDLQDYCADFGKEHNLIFERNPYYHFEKEEEIRITTSERNIKPKSKTYKNPIIDNMVLYKTDLGKIYLPAIGQVINASEIPDRDFASEVLGKTVGIRPSVDVIYAPFDGRVIYMPINKNVIKLESTSGILVHIFIGIGTEKLKGSGFESMVTYNSKFSAGDILLKFDSAIIRQEHCSDVITVILKNPESVKILNSEISLVESKNLKENHFENRRFIEFGDKNESRGLDNENVKFYTGKMMILMILFILIGMFLAWAQSLTEFNEVLVANDLIHILLMKTLL